MPAYRLISHKAKQVDSTESAQKTREKIIISTLVKFL